MSAHEIPAYVRDRVAAGHTLEWSPLDVRPAADRWVCATCRAEVLEFEGTVYGAATERTCEQASKPAGCTCFKPLNECVCWTPPAEVRT